MSTSDLEKAAGVFSTPQQPHAGHPRPCSDFLPAYEEHLNTELRNFSTADSQANIRPFDRIHVATKKTIRRRRAWWSAVSIVFFLIASGIIGSAIFLYRSHEVKDESTETAPRTNMPPRSLVTVTVVPSTVVISVPVATTSTLTLVITLPASAPSTSTQVFFSFDPLTTPSPSTQVFFSFDPLTTSTTSEVIGSTTAPTFVGFQTPVTLSQAFTSETSSTTSSSSSSLEPATTPPPPPPTTVSTTLVSTTTAEPLPTTAPPIITRTGIGPEFCGLPGEACA